MRQQIDIKNGQVQNTHLHFACLQKQNFWIHITFNGKYYLESSLG